MRVPSLLPLMLSLAAAAAATGCGVQARAARVPDVAGQPLDEAKARLEARGLSTNVIGGGKLGVIVESNWQVCEQRPKAGSVATSVELVVARACRGRVPDVEGLELSDARDLLRHAGAEVSVLRLDAWEDWDGDEDDERVCTQSLLGKRADGRPIVELWVEHDGCE